MPSYNVCDLEHEALKVDGALAADDPVWLPGDTLPATPIRVTGRISKAGEGRYYWAGRIVGSASVTCRRCLAESTEKVAEEVHLFFVEPEDEVAEDPDTFRLPPRAHVVDLRPAIREQWLLAAPSFALCRQECKGLCATCGADLNAGPCDCSPVSESRWSVLRAIRDSSV